MINVENHRNKGIESLHWFVHTTKVFQPFESSTFEMFYRLRELLQKRIGKEFFFKIGPYQWGGRVNQVEINKNVCTVDPRL